MLDPSDTNTAVIWTGGFETLQSRTRPVHFAAVPGTFSLSFSFGFATEEIPTDGDILDSMILFIQKTNSGLTAVLFMGDAYGYGWLPYSPDLFPLFNGSVDLTPVDPPNVPFLPENRVAFQVTFTVPPALASGSADLTMMLYDSPNGLNSVSWLGPATVIPPPGVLEVSGTDRFRSFGPYGGIFNPPSSTYVLTNSGGSKLSWRAIPSASWLTVSPVSGELDWGRTTNVTLTVNSRARSLPPGFYTNYVSFLNDSVATNASTHGVELAVVVPPKLELSLMLTGEFGLRLISIPFARFRIEQSLNFTSWSAIHTNTTDANGSFDYAPPVTPTAGFYRASFVYP